MQKRNYSEYFNILALLLIITAAFVLRLYRFFDIPFTHDEFSALSRTHFNNFHDLIEKGVAIDGHPPLIQIFLYYYTQLFGYEEWVVKLPFILTGLLSVFLTYKIALKLFGNTSALLSSTVMASTEFAVMYSQIARPYASGMFFCLCAVYFWINIIREYENKTLRNAIGFVLSATAAAYTHHFSLLLIFFIGISGLFIVKKENIVKYLLLCLAIVVLYIPNVPIILAQLKMKGVGGWLGAPHWDFLLIFLYYICHYSLFVIAFLILIVVIAVLSKKNFTLLQRKFQLIFLCCFLLSFLTGFVYSLCVDPVLQYSSLIFSFPLLVISFFSIIKNQKPVINLLLVAVLLSVNITTLIYKREYYSLFYNSIFEKIITDKQIYQKQCPNVVSMISFHSEITTYYINKYSDNNNFINISDIKSDKEFYDTLQYLTTKTDNIYLGIFTVDNMVFRSMIKELYPYVVAWNNYQEGETFVFSKDEDYSDKNLTQKYDSIIYYSSDTLHVTQDITYSDAVIIPLKQIMNDKNNCIDISCEVLLTQNSNNGYLIAEINGGNKQLLYRGSDFAEFIDPNKKDNWQKIFLSFKLDERYCRYKSPTVTIYALNTKHNDYFVRNMKVKLRTGNCRQWRILEK